MIQVSLFDRDGKFISVASVPHKAEVLLWGQRVFVIRSNGEFFEITPAVISVVGKVAE